MSNTPGPGPNGRGQAITDQVPAEAAGTQGQPQQITLRADARREYVAGSPLWTSPFWTGLSWAIDDVTATFGDDLYERMVRDPMLTACTSILKTAILEDGLQISSGVGDEDDDGYAMAKDIADSCVQMLGDLERPGLTEIMYNMLDGMCYGNKVAELVYDDGQTSLGKPALNLARIKVKPRRTVAFAIDRYRNVVGLLGLVPDDRTRRDNTGSSSNRSGGGVSASVGNASPLMLGGVSYPLYGPGAIITDPSGQANLLPREKFAVLSWHPTDSDPRGSSVLRPAYTPWSQKQDLWNEYRKYLVQFASPVPIGFSDPAAQDRYVVQSDGTSRLMAPEEIILSALEQWRAGAALAFRGNSRVETLFPGGNGDAYIHAFGFYDAQMTVAILHQTLAQGPAQQQHSRAASEVHARVTDSLVAYGRLILPQMLLADIIKPWISFNWGARAQKLAPTLTLGEVEPQDFSQDIMALATAGFKVLPSQLPGIYQKYNLPQPSDDDLQALQNPVVAPTPDQAQGMAAGNAESTDSGQPPSGSGSRPLAGQAMGPVGQAATGRTGQAAQARGERGATPARGG